MIPKDYKNTRGSNMEEPLYFDDSAPMPKLSPEEAARRAALLKEVDKAFDELAAEEAQQKKQKEHITQSVERWKDEK